MTSITSGGRTRYRSSRIPRYTTAYTQSILNYTQDKNTEPWLTRTSTEPKNHNNDRRDSETPTPSWTVNAGKETHYCICCISIFPKKKEFDLLLSAG